MDPCVPLRVANGDKLPRPPNTDGKPPSPALLFYRDFADRVVAIAAATRHAFAESPKARWQLARRHELELDASQIASPSQTIDLPGLYRSPSPQCGFAACVLIEICDKRPQHIAVDWWYN